jgi:hypothetical protein
MSASHRLRVYLVQNGAAASFAAESSPLNRRGDDPAYLNGLSIVEIDAGVRSDELDELIDWAAEICRTSLPSPRDIADKTLCALVGRGCNLRMISFGRVPAYRDYIRKVRKHLKSNAAFSREVIDKAVSVMESWLETACDGNETGDVYLLIGRDGD